MLCLARASGKGPQQAAAIAEAESIPPKFLEAILIQLRHKGPIRSKVGKGGGHELARDPSGIDRLSIVRKLLAKAHELQVKQLSRSTLADAFAEDGDQAPRARSSRAKHERRPEPAATAARRSTRCARCGCVESQR